MKNAFNWNTGEHSIFARDPAFCAAAKTGKTKSQIATESVMRFEQATGRSPGSISGMSCAGDGWIETQHAARLSSRSKAKA